MPGVYLCGGEGGLCGIRREGRIGWVPAGAAASGYGCLPQPLGACGSDSLCCTLCRTTHRGRAPVVAAAAVDTSSEATKTRAVAAAAGSVGVADDSAAAVVLAAAAAAAAAAVGLAAAAAAAGLVGGSWRDSGGAGAPPACPGLTGCTVASS
jgi:hypothetical protein